MSSQAQNAELSSTDQLVETAHRALVELAARDPVRAQSACALALKVKQLRRPEVIARLDAERLTSARSHA